MTYLWPEKLGYIDDLDKIWLWYFFLHQISDQNFYLNIIFLYCSSLGSELSLWKYLFLRKHCSSISRHYQVETLIFFKKEKPHQLQLLHSPICAIPKSQELPWLTFCRCIVMSVNRVHLFLQSIQIIHWKMLWEVECFLLGFYSL